MRRGDSGNEVELTGWGSCHVLRPPNQEKRIVERMVLVLVARFRLRAGRAHLPSSHRRVAAGGPMVVPPWSRAARRAGYLGTCMRERRRRWRKRRP